MMPGNGIAYGEQEFRQRIPQQGKEKKPNKRFCVSETKCLVNRFPWQKDGGQIEKKKREEAHQHYTF
jgi:hypothetical protein